MERISETKELFLRNFPTSLKWQGRQYYRLQHFEEAFLGFTTLVLGSTGSGKTTLLISFLYSLSISSPITIIISGTALVNADYQGRIPNCCILPVSDVKNDFFIKLKTIQEERMEVYKNVTRNTDLWLKLLRTLEKKFPDFDTGMILGLGRELQEIKIQISTNAKDWEQQKFKIERLEAQIINMGSDMLRWLLNREGEAVKEAVTGDIVNLLAFWDFKPYITLVFDDCGTHLRSWPAASELPTVTRHCGITIFMLLHGYTATLPIARGNIRFFIAADLSALTSYTQNTTNKLLEQHKTQLEKMGDLFCETIETTHPYIVHAPNGVEIDSSIQIVLYTLPVYTGNIPFVPQYIFEKAKEVHQCDTESGGTCLSLLQKEVEVLK